MPYGYVIDKERRLVISTASGQVTSTDIKSHEDRLTSDPDFNPEFNQFVDGSAATALDISVDEAKTFAQRVYFSPRSRRAFFALSPAIYGMLRLMWAHHEIAKAQEQIGVFYERNEALKWLGLEALPDPVIPEGAKAPEAAESPARKAKIA